MFIDTAASYNIWPHLLHAACQQFSAPISHHSSADGEHHDDDDRSSGSGGVSGGDGGENVLKSVWSVENVCAFSFAHSHSLTHSLGRRLWFMRKGKICQRVSHQSNLMCVSIILSRSHSLPSTILFTRERESFFSCVQHGFSAVCFCYVDDTFFCCFHHCITSNQVDSVNSWI